MGKFYTIGSSGAADAGTALDTPGNITFGVPVVSLSLPDGDGKRYVEAHIPYTAPNPIGSFIGFPPFLQAPDDIGRKATIGDEGWVFSDIAADAGSFAAVSNRVPLDFVSYDPNNLIVYVRYPAPFEQQTWRLYAPSASRTIQLPIVPANQPNPTPSVTFTAPAANSAFVKGAEYAPNAISFTLVNGLPDYDTRAGGDQYWRFRSVFVNDTTDPRFPLLGGYDIVIEDQFGNFQLNTSPSKNDTENASDWWPVDADPAGRRYRVWLQAWDVKSNRNTRIYPLTPHFLFTVVRQVGTAGQENTGLISGLTATFGYGTDGQGQRRAHIDFTHAVSSHAAYGGVVFWMIRGGIHFQLSGTVTDSPWRYHLPDFPTANESVSVYARSVDTNGNQNSYINLTTPEVAVTLTPPPLGVAGLEYADNVIPDVTFVQLGAALPQADGTYVQPCVVGATKPVDPRFGSAEVVIKYANGTFLTWAESIREFPFRFSFKPPGAVELVTFYVVTRDVNNRRNTIVDGTTPSQVISIGTGSGQLGLDKATLATLASYFEVVGGQFKIKDQGVTNALILNLACEKLLAGTITALLSINSPNINGGAINGATLQLIFNGVTTTIANVFENNAGSNYVGLKVIGPSYGLLAPSTGVYGFVVGQSYNTFRLSSENGVYGNLFMSNGVNTITMSPSFTSSSPSLNLSGGASPSIDVSTNTSNATPYVNVAATVGFPVPQYRINGIKVVSVRKTGWTVPIGTHTRTQFDTAFVTLSQLAERVAALISDLHANGHGLIGS